MHFTHQHLLQCSPLTLLLLWRWRGWNGLFCGGVGLCNVIDAVIAPTAGRQRLWASWGYPALHSPHCVSHRCTVRPHCPPFFFFFFFFFFLPTTTTTTTIIIITLLFFIRSTAPPLADPTTVLAAA